MKYKISALLILITSCITVYAVSVANSPPFENGETLSHTKMNTKFDNVSSAITELDAIHGPIYNAADYVGAGNMTSKTFTLSGFGQGPCDTGGGVIISRTQSVWSYTAGAVANSYDRAMARGNGVAVCQTITNTMHIGGGYHWQSQKRNDLGNDVYTHNFTTPVTKLKEQMRVGETWVDMVSAGAVTVFEKNTLLEHLTDLAVGNFTFNDCLKLHTSRKRAVNESIFERVSYYCRGVGQVKRDQLNQIPNLRGLKWTLSSCNPATACPPGE